MNLRHEFRHRLAYFVTTLGLACSTVESARAANPPTVSVHAPPPRPASFYAPATYAALRSRITPDETTVKSA
ncbi:hypothetical protein P3T18_004043 [Paraburkholderia sp. GAS199]|uniref:hypothetical protein n=1 Tax=Paraburkholderia sp. GAS199 TaxID=3035126 RepID=UPI003D1B53A1